MFQYSPVLSCDQFGREVWVQPASKLTQPQAPNSPCSSALRSGGSLHADPFGQFRELNQPNSSSTGNQASGFCQLSSLNQLPTGSDGAGENTGGMWSTAQCRASVFCVSLAALMLPTTLRPQPQHSCPSEAPKPAQDWTRLEIHGLQQSYCKVLFALYIT